MIIEGTKKERLLAIVSQHKKEFDDYKHNIDFSLKELFCFYDEEDDNFFFMPKNALNTYMFYNTGAIIFEGETLKEIGKDFADYKYAIGDGYYSKSIFYSSYSRHYSAPFYKYDYRYGYSFDNNRSKEYVICKLIGDPLTKFWNKHEHNGVEEFKDGICKFCNLKINENTLDNELLDMFELSYAMLFKQCPFVELMVKTEFSKFILSRVSSDRYDDLFKRNFKKGNNLDEISMMPKWLWKMCLDNGMGLDQWNEIRIWYKKDKFSRETGEAIFTLGVNDSGTIKKIRKLCLAEFNGKRLYTINSLINYLGRVDMYQAIRLLDAIEILNDYIRMCVQMGVEPNTNSNSLKREHDVQARNFYTWHSAERTKQYNAQFEERAKVLNKYAYEDDDLIVMIPKTPTDMINEGIHNSNCVGSYCSSYAEGNANIFFVRRKAAPESSYITVQLNGPCTAYTQAYYSCNRRINSLKDLSFIKKWLDHNKEVNKDYAEAQFFSFLCK